LRPPLTKLEKNLHVRFQNKSKVLSFLFFPLMDLETKRLLHQYYNIASEDLPQQRQRHEWKPDNKFGFLFGIAVFGLSTHTNQLHSLLQNNQIKDQEESFIDLMFDFYIRPCHKSFCTDFEPCQTASTVSSRTQSIARSNSADGLSKENELIFHQNFKKALKARDGMCLFCWDDSALKATTIFSQNDVNNDEASLFKRAGLTQKHQVENGLLLCIKCAFQFHKLKRYVDVVDEKLVVKVVNQTNDPRNMLHQKWLDVKHKIKLYRENEIRFKSNLTCKDGRVAVEPDGEMALYFVQNNPSILPNRTALDLHKRACLIWRMAGGAEPDDDEYCSDDEHEPVDTAALRKRFNLPAQGSL
jgi:hypothetical protein